MYLGIDIGSSAVKPAVVDDAGSVVDKASSALNVSRPHPLWSEQNPADWWSAANNAVSGLALPVRKAVRAIHLLIHSLPESNTSLLSIVS
jgi:xylulokinase